MKAFLMSKDQDFDLGRELPSNSQALTQDLELDTLFNAMALGDRFLFDVAKKTVLLGLSDPETIIYRQNILKDCLKKPSVLREMYQIPIESVESKRKFWLGIHTRRPTSILFESREMLRMFMGLLKKLRNIADEHADSFESEGFKRFFRMIRKELDEEYFHTVEGHLKELKFRSGILISAELGKGNEGVDYMLREPKDKDQSWLKRILARNGPSYSFTIADRDNAGFNILGDLEDRGLNLVANALAQAADHIDAFFNALRVELAFYLGCLNLSEQLSQIGEPICFPIPTTHSERRHSFRGLYDICLALTLKRQVVGNDANADDKDLVIITGANQGGKSTFLRSIGLAQLMTQCGMFAPADLFSVNTCHGLFTHYKREEDVTMKSGKLDEELARMSDIADHITSDSLALFNESFAATNEREGSEIAGQITRALMEKRVKVFFVTHQYEFARGVYDKKMANAIFLRAPRLRDGVRTFKLIEGEPLRTSFGEDVYKKVFRG